MQSVVHMAEAVALRATEESQEMAKIIILLDALD